MLEAIDLKAGGVKGVVVTGCMAQRYAEELGKELPEVDAVIGFEHYNQIGPQVLLNTHAMRCSPLNWTWCDQIERIITASGFAMPEIDVGGTDVPFRPVSPRCADPKQHPVAAMLELILSLPVAQ